MVLKLLFQVHFKFKQSLNKAVSKKGASVHCIYCKDFFSTMRGGPPAHSNNNKRKGEILIREDCIIEPFSHIYISLNVVSLNFSSGRSFNNYKRFIFPGNDIRRLSSLLLECVGKRDIHRMSVSIIGKYFHSKSNIHI